MLAFEGIPTGSLIQIDTWSRATILLDFGDASELVHKHF
jgi:hypothetical protein